MNYVLFLVYLIITSWVLCKIRFVTDAGIGARTIVFLFACKVAIGCVNTWISFRMSTFPDIQMFHQEGLKEYHLLFTNPLEYCTNIFRSGYKVGYGGLFDSRMSYWNDLKSNLVIKLLSVFNIFSRGDLYINIIFYNFVGFFGSLALFRVFNAIYRQANLQLLIGCFLLPSLLYFSSAIHKEGLILTAIGILVFNIYQAMQYQQRSLGRIVGILFFLLFIFLLRNYLFFCLVPAMVAWVLSHKRKYSPLIIFSGIYVLVAILFFVSGSISSRLDLPAVVSQKQWDFKSLEKAQTFIETDTLKPVFRSFLLNAPQAFNHGLLRPYLTEVRASGYLLPLSIELILYEALFVLFLFFRKPGLSIEPFILFGLFFALSVLLITGYTIPVIGAIVRYRSIYLPFIITPLLAGIHWEKLRGFFKLKNIIIFTF